MGIINENSLALTLDSITEAFFFDKSLSLTEKYQVASWLAHRQGQPGSYCDMFAPTKYDFEYGVQVFTGERISSKAATSNILGQETCRALLKLNVSDKKIQESLVRATQGMMGRLTERLSPDTGYY